MSIVLTNNAKVYISKYVDNVGDLQTGFTEYNTIYVSNIVARSLQLDTKTSNNASILTSNLLGGSTSLEIKIGNNTTETSLNFSSYLTDGTKELLEYINREVSLGTYSSLLNASIDKYFSILILLDATNYILLDRCVISGTVVELNISEVVKLDFNIKALKYSTGIYSLNINAITLSGIQGILPATTFNYNEYFLAKNILCTLEKDSLTYNLPIISGSLNILVNAEYFSNSEIIGGANLYSFPTSIQKNAVVGELVVYNRVGSIQNLLDILKSTESFGVPSINNNLIITLKGINNNTYKIYLYGCTLNVSYDTSEYAITNTLAFETANNTTSKSSKIEWV